MHSTAKHSNIFEQFVSLFSALKSAAGDDPKRFVNFFNQSKSLKQVFYDFERFMLKTDFERRVFHGSEKCFPQVPQRFENEWKDYKNRWAGALAHVFLRSLDPELAGDYDPDVKSDTSIEVPDVETDDVFDPLYHDGGKALECGLLTLDDVAGAFDGDAVSNACRVSLGAYDYLENTIGLKLSDIFRRWRTVPVTFMPAHISNKHGDKKGSLLDLLDDAIRAYIAGAPAASIAMCRASLEMVLKQHYKLDYQFENKEGHIRDKGLGELIALASERYDFVQKGRIKPLKKAADNIMHNYSRTKKLSKDDERTILQFLKTVKFLIQRAPGK